MSTSDAEIISGPVLSTNALTDHEASTDNAIPTERSSTDMSETDSDHDINWELKLTGRESPTTERKIKKELIEEYEHEHSPHQSDTETYSPDNDTNGVLHYYISRYNKR